MYTRSIKFALAATVMALGVQGSLAAGEHVPAVKDYASANIMPWISDGAVVAAIAAQNKANSALTQAEIDALDQKWRAGVDGGDTTLIDAVLGNSLSDFLRDKQMASNGVITEIFVMDSKGLNVGQSEVTSDYWQGDEGKWKKTYGSGDAAAIFVDEAEKDESTQMLQSQVSMTIADASGAPIGAITIGINLNEL
ncbi:hypothetical protein [Hoeflea poritis]|uniref:DUF2291 domain-containing protein n=1 Tax=Hoeflea poritis TaxID=2993659 RepID=A0ABT4VNE7_9HYPH|nr:hypothetical protein [Hoeflea poritis]MDA4846242.1 hypothetical protein [Hoeflea poritis]